MWKEASEAWLAVALAITLTGCNGGKADREAAEALYGRASTAVDGGRYSEAAAMLDSLDSAYGRQTEVRRRGMHLRTRVQEGLTLKEIERADSTIAALQQRGAELKGRLRWVSNPIEGYYVAAGAAADVHGTTGLHARMMPDGTFYLISTVSGRGVGHGAVSVTIDGATATTKRVPADGERNDRSSGTEIVTYTPAEADTVAKLIYENPGKAATVTFVGRGSYTMTLSEAQRRGIADLYGVEATKRELMLETARKSVLEERLTKIRQQMARTFE